VALASRGLRNINDKIERIKDDAELKQVRRQALQVIFKGMLAALPLTVLAYLIP
jgi:ABC-type polysaccharide/polyol phosphate transport system ATPase subunit